MSPLLLAILVFVAISIFTARNAKLPRGTRLPWEQPGDQSTEPIPRRVPNQLGSRPSLEEQPTDIDVYKEQELRQAAGQEGAWGDEGRLDRPSLSQRLNDYRDVLDTAAEVRQEQGPGPAVLDTSKQSVLHSSNPLVLGVVWSEILGRPRALRSYRGPRN